MNMFFIRDVLAGMLLVASFWELGHRMQILQTEQPAVSTLSLAKSIRFTQGRYGKICKPMPDLSVLTIIMTIPIRTYLHFKLRQLGPKSVVHG